MLVTEEPIFGQWRKFPASPNAAKKKLHQGCQHKIFSGRELKAALPQLEPLPSPPEQKSSSYTNGTSYPLVTATKGASTPASSASAKGGLREVDPAERVRQLERNLAFLREEHDRMLSALHNEVEGLKRRNNDLQFQLAMGGFAEKVPATPPSGNEDNNGNGGGKWRLIRGPAEEVDALEETIKQLQAEIHEAKSRNLFLSNLVEEQKERLERLAARPPTSEAVLSKQEGNSLRKLSQAEAMIRRLREENLKQKREIQELKGNVDRNSRLRYRGCNHPRLLQQPSSSRSMSLETRPPGPPPPGSLGGAADGTLFPALRSSSIGRRRRNNGGLPPVAPGGVGGRQSSNAAEASKASSEAAPAIVGGKGRFPDTAKFNSMELREAGRRPQ